MVGQAGLSSWPSARLGVVHTVVVPADLSSERPRAAGQRRRRPLHRGRTPPAGTTCVPGSRRARPHRKRQRIETPRGSSTNPAEPPRSENHNDARHHRARSPGAWASCVPRGAVVLEIASAPDRLSALRHRAPNTGTARRRSRSTTAHQWQFLASPRPTTAVGMGLGLAAVRSSRAVVSLGSSSPGEFSLVGQLGALAQVRCKGCGAAPTARVRERNGAVVAVSYCAQWWWRLPSGTVTFLFTDIEGSTVRWELDPHGMSDGAGRSTMCCCGR